MSSAWGVMLGAGLIAGASLGVIAVPLLGALVLIVHAVRRSFHLVPVAVICIAGILGALRFSGSGQPDVPGDLELSTGGTATVVNLPVASGSGERVLMRMESIETGAGRSDTGFIAMAWLPDNAVAAPGDRLVVTWSVTELDELPPGFARYVRSQGAQAVVYVRTIEAVEPSGSWLRPLVRLRRFLSDRFQVLLPGDTGALASGIVTGDDSALGERAERAFLHTGTSHVTAVSGSNVSMLLALWNVIVRPGRVRRTLIVQLTIIGTIWAYAILVGLEPPAVRAALVATIGLMAVRAGRKADPMTLVMLASAILAMWNPAVTSMLSFWLSLVASAAIVSRLPGDTDTTWTGALGAIGSGVFVAYLGTLPIVLTVFGTWSLTAVIANALLAPAMLVAFPVTFAFAGLMLVAPALAPLVAWLPEAVLAIALLTVERLAALGAPLELGTAGRLVSAPVAIVCGLATLGMSRDGRRWSRLTATRWAGPMPRMMVPAVALGMLAGCLAASAVTLFR